MDLLRALRLGTKPCLALTGAGGKTTALFQLARQLERAGSPLVILTTTTHLGIEQLPLADQHYELTRSRGLPQNPPPGVLLFSGPRQQDGRAGGLSGDMLADVRELAESCQAPLLIEADGARRRPLKAPAEHEPAVPAWVETAVVVAGLSGLGRPLAAPWVHRPEIFARLSEIDLEAPVSPDGLISVLTSHAGGLKGLPETARRVALLNQADTPELQAAGAQMAGRLLNGGYASVSVAALEPGESGGVLSTFEPVAGIVLAAGGSSRFGQAKQLLTWRGEPFVRCSALAALAAGLAPVVVVSGAQAPEVQAALGDLPVQVIYNPDWQAGQSTSLNAGLRCLPTDSGAAIFLLADQPQAPDTLLRSLVARHAADLAPIVAPLIDGQRGNPVLFDRQTFPDLLLLQGDVGGRALFGRYPVNWLPWHDASLLLDVDRPEDYQRLQEL